MPHHHHPHRTHTPRRPTTPLALLYQDSEPLKGRNHWRHKPSRAYICTQGIRQARQRRAQGRWWRQVTARSRRHGSSRSKCRLGSPCHLFFDCCPLVILRVCCSLFPSGRIRMSTPLLHHHTSATQACFEDLRAPFSTEPIVAALRRLQITARDPLGLPAVQSHRAPRPPTNKCWSRVLRPLLPYFRIRQPTPILGQIMTIRCITSSRMMQFGISGQHGTSRSMATASSSSAQSTHSDLQTMGPY